jgi:Ser/Thr protein kinase RdoA (MazF antagonist)
MDFLKIPTDAQAVRLEGLAREALREWSLADATIELVKYRENAVFSVTASDGARYAMRVHRPGYRTDAQIRSEFEWMAALSSAGIRTPEVVPTRRGDALCIAGAAGVPEQRQCDLFKWIAGQPVGTIEAGVGGEEQVLLDTYRTLGQMAAAVHEHGRTWAKPDWFSRPSWDVDSLVGDEPTFGKFWELECLSDEQRRILLDARDKARETLEAWGQSSDRYGLIHGDFLPENVYVSTGAARETRLLDFDDCGQSWYVFELATSVYFLRSQPNYELLCRSYVDGYRTARALPEDQLALMPTMLMARGLSYVGWPAGRPEIDFAREVAPFLAEDATMLARDYLAS